MGPGKYSIERIKNNLLKSCDLITALMRAAFFIMDHSLAFWSCLSVNFIATWKQFDVIVTSI